MKLICSSLFLIALGLLVQATAAERGGHMLAHMVFFELKEDSPAAREKLVEACKKYLSGHEGTAHFSVGTIAEDMKRDVNDRDFDVALHVIFKDRAAHDRYMTHERHLKFIEECKENWKKVRVFDSYLSPYHAPEEAPDATGARIPLPDPAGSFAGMIQGKVVSKRHGQIVLLVDKVLDEWKHSKAQDAKSLIGKQVLVEAFKGEGDGPSAVARFVEKVKEGEVIAVDVANKEGDVLSILELTEDQREWVKKRE